LRAEHPRPEAGPAIERAGDFHPTVAGFRAGTGVNRAKRP